MSSPTRWVRVRELFDASLEQPEESRAAWVRQAAGGEELLCQEVLSLLDALHHARETLERPAAGVVVDSFLAPAEGSLVGRRAGAYEVTRLLGYGGMGAVYEGRRTAGGFDQRVAIKFLRPGMGSEVALRRFRYERKILASLNHRNIAALHDGGLTDDGQPYFVMEYVEGTPITAWCAERRLPVRERVALFRQVCAAVQHAHQQLVVHRDLKPGNIFVTADGTVKLLDFGIAKLLREEEGPGQLPMTRGGMRLFTPEYASPEQVRGLTLAPASDIYSLGVVLFELVTGRRPLAMEGKLLAEIEVEICAVPAPRPSASVTPEAAVTFGEGSMARVRRHLAGDLDAIVLTALAKEPAVRYPTAEQLATDLRRWLDGHPVSARRTWLGYRARKFVARHALEVTAVALAVAALVGGSVSTARQARIAGTEASKAAEVNSFISNMLAAADPGDRGRDVTVREVLDQAAANVQQRTLDPEVEAEIRHTIGQTYYGLGLYDSAAVHARRAFELRRTTFGMRDPRTAQSLSYVVAVTEAVGEYARAESLARANVAQWRAMPKPDLTELASALDNVARQVETQGRLDEAHQIQLEALGLRRQATDSAAKAALSYTLNNMAVSYMYQGRQEAAESLFREGLAVEAACCGRDTPNYGELNKALGGLLDEMGRKREGDSLAREGVRILRRALGPTHTNYLRAVNNLATLRYTSGDPGEALELVGEVVAAIGGSVHEGDQTAAVALQLQGLSLDSLGRHADAEAPLRRSLALRQKYLPAGHWAIASSESVVGYHLGLVRRYPEAEALLTRAYAKLVESRGADALVTTRVAFRLAEMYGRWGRRADSVAWAARGTPKG